MSALKIWDIPNDLADQVERHLERYPSVEPVGVAEALRLPIPVWHLAADATILDANPLAFWLWQVAAKDDLVGKNVFDVLCINLARIPIPENDNFLARASAVASRIAALAPEDAAQAATKAFLRKVQAADVVAADPALKAMAEQSTLFPAEEWHYKLRIYKPRTREEHPIISDIYKTTLLAFDVQARRDRITGNFIVEYQPDDNNTGSVVRKEYRQLRRFRVIIDNTNAEDNAPSTSAAAHETVQRLEVSNITKENSTKNNEQVVSEKKANIGTPPISPINADSQSSPFARREGVIYDTRYHARTELETVIAIPSLVGGSALTGPGQLPGISFLNLLDRATERSIEFGSEILKKITGKHSIDK